MPPLLPEHCTLTTASRGTLLDFSNGAVVMGILNTTPDSFYDGGRLGNEKEIVVERAVKRALAMEAEGASIIDIGGESTRPGAEPVSKEEEIARTVPVIAALRKRSRIAISIDTSKAAVAEAALQAGADIVNDISGFTFDPAMAATCGRHGAAAVLMHTPVRPEAMGWSTAAGNEEGDIIERVLRFLAAAVEHAAAHGVTSIALDPGFGFGKSVEENFLLLERLAELRRLGRPLLVGVSRKSFLARVGAPRPACPLPPEGRLAASVAAETVAVLHGAAIIRAHDVAEAVAAIGVVRALRKGTQLRSEP